MQNIYESKQKLKYIFIVTAVFITVISVLITNNLVRNLAIEEGKKINVWAESIKLMTTPQPENNSSNEGVYNDYDKLLLEIIEGNNTIPVFLINEFGKVEHSMNIDKIQKIIRMNFGKKRSNNSSNKTTPLFFLLWIPIIMFITMIRHYSRV